MYHHISKIVLINHIRIILIKHMVMMNKMKMIDAKHNLVFCYADSVQWLISSKFGGLKLMVRLSFRFPVGRTPSTSACNLGGLADGLAGGSAILTTSTAGI